MIKAVLIDYDENLTALKDWLSATQILSIQSINVVNDKILIVYT